MEPSPALAARRTGRPLSFDRDAALVSAMHLFWRHGYEATSIAELTRAMGITPPSLYAAFGNKRRLFLEAVDLYLGGLEAVEQSIADAASAHDAARDLLVAAVIGDTGSDTPPGCLLASSLVTSSEEADAVRETLAEIRRGIEAALRARIEQDVGSGLLPVDTNAEALAGHVFAVVQGMSTLAKDGAGRSKLMGIVDTAMAGWPRAA
ncbi:TetR/AcrR family transcriptional regulator [Aureimonas sp. Leaf454]|uniref:TetR/AcrR family transcriptional regulator n=1 Tax=Aureimonas sp. Leaf454 TaxID=1736381 RepID=UPI000A4992D3|nr:TetR/AcrR family transcriptional regulator [Aureimonas sp. Leaf454]